MHACTHKQAFLSCTVAVSNRRTVLTLMHIYRHAHSFNSVSSIIGRQPWLFFFFFWLYQTSHQHHTHPYHSFILLISSFHPFLSVRPSLSPSPLFPPSFSLCLRASSQSVSEKCCCQLTFPITPPVAKTMDTLLTSGDRAERERNLKCSTRAISLSHSLAFTSPCCLSVSLSRLIPSCLSAYRSIT